jgi:5-dehydro-4-deoxyglucarate dehydratase
VKAGLEIVGQSAGAVRPPLVEFSPEDRRDLAALIARADALISGSPVIRTVKAAI